MDRIVCMEAFVRVADARSFAEAARRWGRSKAVVSKYVAQLETHLGVPLLQRTTRSVALTDAGHGHYDSSRQVLGLLEESESQLRADHVSLRGPLRITAPPGLLSMGPRSVVASFLRRFGNVQLDIDITSRAVDLVEERIDVAIRVTQPEDSSLIARRLAPVEVILAASDTYLDAYGTPQSPRDLVHHQCLLDGNYRFSPRWPFNVDGESYTVKVDGPVRTNDLFTTRSLALEGVGIVMTARTLVDKYLASGQLREVLPKTSGVTWSAYAITSQRRHLSGRARAFIEHLREHLPQTLR